MACKVQSQKEKDILNKMQPKKFNKTQILKSQRYINRSDILSVILKDGETYTQSEIERLMDEFMKGKVK